MLLTLFCALIAVIFVAAGLIHCAVPLPRSHEHKRWLEEDAEAERQGQFD